MAPNLELRPEMQTKQEFRFEPEIKHLIQLTLELRQNKFNSLKGIDGLKEAGRILYDRNCVGILIGGLAEEVFAETNDLEKLAQHKDVDVIALQRGVGPDQFFTPQRPFENGIDWWYLEKDETSDLTYIRNSNGSILHYNINPLYFDPNASSAGLNILDYSDLLKAKYIEARALNQQSGRGFDELGFDDFRRVYADVRELDEDNYIDMLRKLREAGLDIRSLNQTDIFRKYSPEETKRLNKIREKIAVKNPL